jgi:sugar-specific transcriptional regulator TrmB
MKPSQLFTGIVIGIVLGGTGGYFITPKLDVTSLYNQILELESQSIDYQNQISTLQGQVNDYSNKLSELNVQIIALQENITDKDGLLYSKNLEIETLNNQNSELEIELSNLEAENKRLTSISNITLVTVSFSRPEETASILEYWIGKANSTIRLMVMLITHDELADALKAAHNRGVEVKIIIDSDWETSSGSDFSELLSAGIDIRGDERSGLMHHKVMIIDGYIIITGSYNWSASAEDTNDENVLILRSPTISQLYLSEFNRIWSQTSSSLPLIILTQYNLLIGVMGSGSTSPSPGDHIHDEGTFVQVTATPASGWKFDHWILDGINIGSTIPFSITMNSDHKLTAVFTEETSSPPSEGIVIINEVEANPLGNDNNGSVYEWIELYNPSEYSVNIGDWTISTTTGITVTITIQEGTTLSPGQYKIIERGQQWLDNEGEQVVLRDSFGNIKDMSSVINDTDNDSYSWQRYPNGRDTDSSTDWSFKPSTKGCSNV